MCKGRARRHGVQRHRTARFLSIPSSTSGLRRVSSDVSCTRGGVCPGLGEGEGEGGMECAFGVLSCTTRTVFTSAAMCVSGLDSKRASDG